MTVDMSVWAYELMRNINIYVSQLVSYFYRKRKYQLIDFNRTIQTNNNKNDEQKQWFGNSLEIFTHAKMKMNTKREICQKALSVSLFIRPPTQCPPFD